MMRLAEIFVIAHAMSGLILFMWVFWLRRNDSGIWRCPACKIQFVLLQQKTEPKTYSGSVHDADLQCPECLACFDLWHPVSSIHDFAHSASTKAATFSLTS